MYKIKAINFKRFGGPFLHRELGLIKRDAGEDTIFIVNRRYPYDSAMKFLEKDFVVLRIPSLLIKVLAKLGLTAPEIDVNTKFDYSKHLGALYNKNILSQKNRLDIALTSRPSIPEEKNSCNQPYKNSARDYDLDDIQFVVDFLEKNSKSFLIAGEDKSKTTIEEINSCNSFFGTNSGPYVCAMSLGKPSFLINIIPFIGTNCYHKINDFCLPMPIKKRGGKKPLSIAKVVKNKLANLTEQEVVEKGYNYEAIPKEVLKESLNEFLTGPANQDISWAPSDKQLEFKLMIEKQYQVENGPIFPDAYINYLNA